VNLPEQISRRTMLQGLGCTIALPWLESMNVFAADGTAAVKPPQRFACLFQGDGISPHHWWSKGDGAAMELGSSLESLIPYKEKLNVVNGLFNRHGDGGHARCTGNILSGANLVRGRVITGGISMDQKLSQHFEATTPVPSMVLGCEQPVSGFHESQYSMVYASHISWRTPSSPIPIELFPALAFDSLFGGQTSKLQGSILDHALSQANDLRGKVSGTDRVKIDEYLTSVRETEKQVQMLNKASKTPLPPASERPPVGQPKDFKEYAKLMCDIIALAFQTDKTRVATLLLCRDLSGLFYPFLDVRLAHHPSSHNDQSDAYERVSRYYVGQLAHLASRLAAMPEGEGTVLDNSCLLFLSNMWSGSRHDSTKVPLLLVGGLGGTLETGRVLDYTNRGDENRRLCSLYLSLMDRMGVSLDRFGDADARLAGL
jgi:Protein of unknown function (DUF1552)